LVAPLDLKNQTLTPNPDTIYLMPFFNTKDVGKESNWIPTNPRGGFEVLFRFYGPEKPLFEKTWRLPDIEKA